MGGIAQILSHNNQAAPPLVGVGSAVKTDFAHFSRGFHAQIHYLVSKKDSAGSRKGRENIVSSVSTQVGSQRTEDWQGLVARIRNCERTGLEEFYLIFAKGIRFHLSRHLAAQNLEVQFQETFSLLVEAIQRGDVREPERLPGFIRTFLRESIADASESVPMVMQQKAASMRVVLEQLPTRDREALIRFYLQEKTLEKVCQEMNLSEAQFCRLKSRAQARFAKIAKSKSPQAAGDPFSLRTSA